MILTSVRFSQNIRDVSFLTTKLKGLKMKKIIVIALLLTASVALSACETVKGAGRDLQNAGNALDEAL